LTVSSKERTFVPGLPQLNIQTLLEDWALMASVDAHWIVLAKRMGKKPSEWIDSQGDRMYGAVIWLSTKFDLDDIIKEDDTVTATCEIQSMRKPHALSVARFAVGGKVKVEMSLLSSFIKRTVRGSNKKFAKARELWT
jgi:probable biosynthetic protein (TIGR04098 family)